MPTSKAGLNSQAYSELQLAVANLQAQIDNLGGGVFKLISLNTGRINAASSGDILVKNITDVAGATHMKVTLLCTDSQTVAEPDMQLETEKGILFTGTLADSSNPASDPTSTDFGVYSWYAVTSATNANAARFLKELYCSELTIRKTTGVTGQIINYAIEYGVIE